MDGMGKRRLGEAELEGRGGAFTTDMRGLEK